MNFLLALISIFLIISCKVLEPTSCTFGTTEREMDLLEELRISKEIASELKDPIAINYTLSNWSGLRQERTFFEQENETYKYCENSSDQSDEGIRSSIVIDENISEEVENIVSLESIYDDCKKLIQTTDFSKISSEDENHSFNSKIFKFVTNDQGLVVQCGVLDYEKVSVGGVRPNFYKIVEVSELDGEALEQLCVENK